MIKLLTFDLDNTLWDIDPVIIQAEESMRQWIRQQVPEAVAQLEMDQLKQIYRQVAEQHPEVAHHPTNFRKKLLYKLFTNASLSHEHAHQMSEEAFSVFYKGRNQIELYHQAEEILTALSARWPLIALTNGNANLGMIGIERFFVAHFSAESEGHPKPHRAMFERALQHANVAPDEAIHIGDHPREDIVAASDLGFHTIWFNQGGRQDASLCKPSREISDLSQLPNAVADIATMCR